MIPLVNDVGPDPSISPRSRRRRERGGSYFLGERWTEEQEHGFQEAAKQVGEVYRASVQLREESGSPAVAVLLGRREPSSLRRTWEGGRAHVQRSAE